MLVRGERLLPRTEPFTGELPAASFQESGIDVRFGRSPARVERPVPGDPVTVHTDDGGLVEADEILVATGRRAAVGDIGLDTVGLEPHGPLGVDASMRATGVPDGWLYAVGDVNGRNLLTHMGKYQARVCGDVIAARSMGRPDDLPALCDTADDRGAPQVIFTDPQVCTVGRTEAQARADGFTVRAVEYDIGAVTGAYLQADDYTGRAKGGRGRGPACAAGRHLRRPGGGRSPAWGHHRGDRRGPPDRLWHAVPVFPAVSEIWLKLLEEYGL